MTSETRPKGQSSLAMQLAIFLVAAVTLIPLVAPGAAVVGGFWIKLAFLARVAALVLLATWMLHRRSLSWSSVGLRRPEWRRFLIALPVGLIITVFCAKLAGAALARAGFNAPNYAMFAPIKGDLGQYLFWVLPVTIGTAAFGEELLFRGFMLDAMIKLLGRDGRSATMIAVIAQAILFGLLHFYQGIGGIITAGAVGLAFGLTWLLSGRNLWVGIILHVLLDGSAMTAIYLGYVKVT